MAKQRKRRDKPSRYRKARDDATVGSITKKAEKLFGLPEGSVKLVYPSGRKARTDSTVGKVRGYWHED